ncbi:AAA-like domain-containing protein [Nostoc sp. 'Lobaria pulmonaria (5183) cyanobiont']|uniref:AAA-like domain-containing protein n=1 Tax=Nostoc sp. 'Lobaria pulmonaria (5183) cyanobiont' TaxID=1618022 RepID=UPI0022775C30|nr:AAA-like domain-containing protein [Nostoc sp. 'Lobaria pulmonaria (5183) cyanobiont']
MQGKFCYVFSSRQMGKSSLRLQTRHKLEQASYSCVSINMTRIGNGNITPAQWYKGIVVDLLRSFNVFSKVNIKAWWSEREDLPALQRLSQFVEDILLVELKTEKIFIFIDEIELLLSGLVTKQQGQLIVKNRIYEEVFNQTWVEKQLAKLRPYSQALNAWVASEHRDNSRLLRGTALLEALAWSQGKSLSDLDYQFLAASQECDRREVETWLEAERTKEVKARLVQEQKAARFQRLFFLKVVLPTPPSPWMRITFAPRLMRVWSSAIWRSRPTKLESKSWGLASLPSILGIWLIFSECWVVLNP